MTDDASPAAAGSGDALLASGLLVVAFLVFSVMAVLARDIAPRIPVIEMVFVRQALAFVILAPVYRRHWPLIRHPRRLTLHLARGVTAIGAMACGLTAVIVMPLADATAIQMTEALLATALAAVLLGEQIGWQRWTATVVGLVGVGVMLRPFGGGFDANGLIALSGAVCGALSMIVVRLGAEHDRTETVMFWQGLVVLVLVTPPTVMTWVTPHLADLAILLAMSVLFALGQWMFTAALRLSDTASLAPLQYVRLIMMVLIGWLAYAELPTPAASLGALLILASATYTLRRNAAGTPGRPLSTPPSPTP